jgi:mRNA interferase MazF
MISSNLARGGHPSRLLIRTTSSEGKAAGLRLDSVLMTDNLATVLEGEIDSLLGRITEMAAVNAAIKHTIGLE